MDVSDKELSEEQIRHYSNLLSDLWDSYLKYLHVGMAASGFTIVVASQFIKGVKFENSIMQKIILVAIVGAGISGICFGLCRWISQIIMERQAYGPRELTLKYFQLTETRPANALRYSTATMKKFYAANDFLKYIASTMLILSWICILSIISWNLDMLSKIQITSGL